MKHSDLKNAKHKSEPRRQLQNLKATDENSTVIQPNTAAFTTHLVVLVTFGWNQGLLGW